MIHCSVVLCRSCDRAQWFGTLGAVPGCMHAITSTCCRCPNCAPLTCSGVRQRSANAATLLAAINGPVAIGSNVIPVCCPQLDAVQAAAACNVAVSSREGGALSLLSGILLQVHHRLHAWLPREQSLLHPQTPLLPCCTIGQVRRSAQGGAAHPPLHQRPLHLGE